MSIVPLIKLYKSYCNVKYHHFIKLVTRFTVIATVGIFLLDHSSIFSIEHSDTVIKLYKSYCNVKYHHFIKLVTRFTVIATVGIFLLDHSSIFSIEHSDTVIYIIIFITLLLGTVFTRS